jgi:superfamily II DNA or RNA helicase
MKIRARQIADIPLWDHQRQAVTAARNYYRDRLLKAALIRMPTGTGKSGVIAVLARCFKDTPTVLVLTPWIHLRKQLASDIDHRFWNRVGVDPSSWPKPVYQFTPATAKEKIDASKEGPSVFVCNIQTLQTLYRERSRQYERLRSKTSLVIVDEGHREPAPEWADAVRGMRKPTVLFTATPYRNDHRIFNVDPNHVYVFTHHEAVGRGYVRDVEFHLEEFGTSPEAFVGRLLEFYRQHSGHLGISSAVSSRVIVRCETSEQINRIAGLLRAAGQSVVAVHDRFSGETDEYHFQAVPNPETNHARFWVHQNKLIEGLDDPSFRILAIFGRLANARGLVQQIGRVIRNPSMRLGERAFIFCRPVHKQHLFWENYRRYEQVYESDIEKYELQRLFADFVSLQPPFQYFERNYRARFDIASEDAYQELNYPLRAKAYLSTRRFSFRDFAQSVLDEWRKADFVVNSVHRPDRSTWVIIYVLMENSPVLLDQALIQVTMCFTVFRQVRRYLFFYDTQGNEPTALAQSARPIDPGLGQLLFVGDDARITQVSLLNTDLGRHSVRRRTIQARSIADIAPGLADHAQVASTAVGYTRPGNRDLLRRYVGLSRGRISDPSSVPHDYREYVAWVESLADTLDASNEPLPVFDRFATFVSPPEDREPLNILLDVDDVTDTFVTAEPDASGKYAPLQIDEFCYEVTNGRFICIANSRGFPVSVRPDTKKDRYVLESPELDRAYVRRTESGREARGGLVSYLDRTQSFRVVTRTHGVIYAHGHFYEPKLALGGRGRDRRLDLLQIFRPIPELAQVTSEKGETTQANGRGWGSRSVFDLVDKLGRGTSLRRSLQGINLLVCDDAGSNETADFIAADSESRRVIFIHAKVPHRPTKRSASAFHVICSQAVKNLDYLNPYSAEEPPNIRLWNKPWSGGTIGKVRKRIRRGEGTAAEMWSKLRNIIRDPSSTREVWLILGKGFSIEVFEQERNKTVIEPEIIQMLYLLQSTWAAISSVGAVFRIYCSP